MKFERWSVPVLLVSLTACAEVTEGPDQETSGTSAALLAETPERALPAAATVEPPDATVVSVPLPASATPTVEPARLVEVAAAPRELTFGAVGIEVVREGGAIVVRRVVEGMPAASAGVADGSRIVAVDGMSVTDMGLDQFVALVRGEPGTSVELTVATGEIVEDVVVARQEMTVTESRCERVRRLRTETEFGGVGMRLAVAPDGVFVRDVEPGLPAAVAGVASADRIVSVDGLVVAGAPLADVIGAIRGDVGTTVTLGLRGANGLDRTLELERVALAIPASLTCTR